MYDIAIYCCCITVISIMFDENFLLPGAQFQRGRGAAGGVGSAEGASNLVWCRDGMLESMFIYVMICYVRFC